MKGYKYLFKNIGLLAISQFGTKILSFFLVPLYTNILSTTEYGMYDLFTTTVGLLVPIVTWNVGESILIFVLDKEKDKEKWEIFAIGIKYAIIGFFITLGLVILNRVLGVFTAINEYWYYMPILLLLTVVNTDFSYFARGIDKVKETAIGGILTSVTMIGLNIIFLVFLGLGLHGYFLAYIIGILVQIVYLFMSCQCWKYIKKSEDKALEKEMIAFSTPLIINNIGWWINNASDRYVVTLLCGVAENGIYSVGYKIPSLLNMFQTIFAQAWTMSAVKDFDPQDKNGFFTRMYNSYNCGMTIVCACIIATSRLFAHFLYAKDFFVAWRYVPFLTIAIVFGSLAGYLGGVFAAVKDSKIFSKSTVVGAIVNMALNIILVYYFGPIGAAVATAVSYFVVWLIRLKHAKKYIKIRIKLLRDFMAYILLLFQSLLLFKLSDGFILYLLEFVMIAMIVVLFKNEIVEVVKHFIGRVSKKELLDKKKK